MIKEIELLLKELQTQLDEQERAKKAADEKAATEREGKCVLGKLSRIRTEFSWKFHQFYIFFIFCSSFVSFM